MIISKYEQIIKLIDTASTIAVFMHINPDGDCIGSALALTKFLKNKNKSVICYAPNLDRDCLPDKFAFLDGFFDISIEKPTEKFDLCIAVDVAEATRLGDICYRIFIKGSKTALVDHHLPTQTYADVEIREQTAASTTQILYKILSDCDDACIDEKVAECLYTGLLTDSGSFSFESTTPETHIVAAKLLEKGINASEINRYVIKDVKQNVYVLKNRILSNTEKYEDGKIGLIVFTQKDFVETATDEKDTDGIINNVINIIGVELAISISEIGDKAYKISFRSKHNVDSSACAKCFGGGGHFHAAGCRAYGYFEDVKAKVLSVAKEMLSYA